MPDTDTPIEPASQTRGAGFFMSAHTDENNC